MFTFLPISFSLRKNCAPKSSSFTSSWSSNAILATPAKAKFLQTSLLNAQIPMMRMLAFPILEENCCQRKSNRSLCLKFTVVERRVPTIWSVCHRLQLHLFEMTPVSILFDNSENTRKPVEITDIWKKRKMFYFKNQFNKRHSDKISRCQ